MNRRGFLRFSVGGLTVFCFASLGACHHDDEVPKQRFAASGRPEPVDENDDRTVVLWVETGVCTGCSCSLLGNYAPPAELLVPDIRLAYQPTLMEGFGAPAIDQLLATARAHAGRFVLVVDGAIPSGAYSRMAVLGTGADRSEHTADQLVAGLAAQAGRVVAIGTCACFGGIPGSAPNTGAHLSVADVIGATPIRIPGCPPNPAWIVGALTALLRGDAVPLDPLGRPVAYFGAKVHDGCARRERFAANDFATAPGDPERCLLKVGCKGTIARGDCPSRQWQGRSYCVEAGHPCIGCTSPAFLDARPTVNGVDVGEEGRATTPFYGALEV